ncbi:MAG: undecaprenyldiphospho-muramoylpentapeptide beta-N-acetylglucosaminyltransferase [Clostridiales bacterium]|nr:undecaprenyldiphospho-muramoylpentapeptide beta-N-acetylglucosaminyltransferase [Clostridiales bacterium]
MKKTTIVFTGGGTAGHVTPNLAIIEKLDPALWDMHYIGTENGLERTLLVGYPAVQYHAVDAGKLRRYFSLKTLTMPYHVLHGMAQSRALLRRLQPKVLFSKGGYVTVPVVLSAPKSCHVFVHESDYSPGLANRMELRRADTVCCSFSDTLSHFPSNVKAVHTGTPIRAALYAGEKSKGLAFCGFSGQKPVLLCTGGSLGAGFLNETLRAALPRLLASFDIVQITGKGKVDESFAQEGYKQFEYVGPEMGDLFAAADLVLARAGANTVFELTALQKPALLIPLPATSSRGDQLHNAEYMRRNGYAEVLMQEQTTPELLVATLQILYTNRGPYIARMAAARADGTREIVRMIEKTVDTERQP